MKISHREIEECRRSPRAWAQARMAGPGIWRLGYNQALLSAIYRYHRSLDAVTARAHLADLIRRHFTDPERIHQVQADLAAYIGWHHRSGVIVADTRIRLAYSVNGYLDMGGLVSRLDITRRGYDGLLLGVASPTWRDELRMPLIQDAVAQRYARPVTDVSVGVQQLDGTNLATHTFSLPEIAAARDRFRQLGDNVRPFVPTIP